ncbi:MAG: hypothetical protein LBR55_04415 [Bacteroidales bacterium]|jgi:hypothetical protein|nr:hypothetical protein [Bacteroidales bacterium]
MFDFTVLHTELAKNSKSSICAVSIAHYENGEKASSKTWLIKPPKGFDKSQTHEYSIKETDVKDSPTFDKVWSEIKSHLENKLIIAFNANYQIANLIGTYEYYRTTAKQKSENGDLENKDLEEKFNPMFPEFVKENPTTYMNSTFEFLCLFILLREAYVFPYNTIPNSLESYRKIHPFNFDLKNNYLNSMVEECAVLFLKLVDDTSCYDFLKLKHKLNITMGECFFYNTTHFKKLKADGVNYMSVENYLPCLVRADKKTNEAKVPWISIIKDENLQNKSFEQLHL